jgi:hypothetical protein
MIAPPSAGVGKITLPAEFGLRLSDAMDNNLLAAPTRCVLFSTLKK